MLVAKISVNSYKYLTSAVLNVNICNIIYNLGLSWDPVGKFHFILPITQVAYILVAAGRYLATQSEECLKIWKIDNWECVESITDPFKEVILIIKCPNIRNILVVEYTVFFEDGMAF